MTSPNYWNNLVEVAQVGTPVEHATDILIIAACLALILSAFYALGRMQ